MFKKSPLDGYWEEGYHYYLEIRGGKAVLRDYAKRVIFETSIKYDKKSIAKGEETDLTLSETVLSRAASGEPMTWIKRLYYKNGEIIMDYFYTIMGDTTYTLKKVDCGPFDNIIIRDKEILPKVQGLWLEWRKGGVDESETGLLIKGDTLRYGGKDFELFCEKIHAISYRGSDDIYLVPKDLTRREFRGMTLISVEENMLTSRMIICDASAPLLVFLRKEDYDKTPIPPEATEPIRNTMLCE